MLLFCQLLSLRSRCLAGLAQIAWETYMSHPDCVTDTSHDRHGASSDDRHTGLKDSHDRQRTRVDIGESDGPWPIAADRTCSAAKFPGDVESEAAAVDLLHRWRCRAGSSGTDCAGFLQLGKGPGSVQTRMGWMRPQNY